MANVKITALSEITPSATDVLPVVDVAANVTSKTTVANIPKNASNGTAATPSHSFASDTDTGMWRRASNTLAFSTGAAQRVELASDGNVLIGGTLPSAPAISLNNNGSSTFLGELTVNRPTGQASALVIRENNVEKIKLKPSGQALFSGPVSIGGTAAINTIDVYEEGDYTPFLTSSTGNDPTQSYASQSASYVRIGQLCSVRVNVKFASSGVSAGTGSARVNLPFQVSGFPAGVISISKSFTGNAPVVIQGSNGTGFATLKRNLSNDNCGCDTVQNNSQISFSLVYEIA